MQSSTFPCCGCGFHSKFLIDKGHHVISFDKSEEMLNFAYKKQQVSMIFLFSFFNEGTM
jgi:predicted TPR repeat methyltransferase